MHDPSSCPVGPVAVVIKLGGAAITHKQQLETLNGEVLAVAARQLAELQAAIGPRFVVVHGAGSFGHHNAAAAGVAHGRESGSIAGCADLLRGFAATRASVTKLSQAVVAALLAHGVPAVAVSPCPTWTTRRRQVAADGCDGVAALLAAGLVPVLHGDAVLDLELGCTILSGDTLITRLCERFRPPYVAFLTNVQGIYSRPPEEPGALLIARLHVDTRAEPHASEQPGSDSGCSLPCGAKAYAQDGSAVEGLLTSSAAHDTTGGVAAKIREAAAVARLGSEVRIAAAGSAAAAAAARPAQLPAGWQGTVVRCVESGAGS